MRQMWVWTSETGRWEVNESWVRLQAEWEEYLREYEQASIALQKYNLKNNSEKGRGFRRRS